MKTWSSGAVVLTSVALMLTAACGASTGDGEPKSRASATASAQVTVPTTKAPEANGSAPAGTLTLASNAKLGPIVTDSTGFTLYRYTKDSSKPPKSACAEDCAKLWPPVPAGGASLPSALDPALIGSVTRPDGTKQLTVAGTPVYRYAKDTKPGDVKGEGVGGAWFASLPKEGVPGLEDALADYMGSTRFRRSDSDATPAG
ncbi:hypothetical protein [Streptomyces cavernae]|uniref:hypothetical protein n=1 Tax=Streptomyces cavernae TaxID=2259034 RepID=UPI000FEBCBBC|nr:hypothetical protein [Streptomyces cavernae]